LNDLWLTKGKSFFLRSRSSKSFCQQFWIHQFSANM